MVAQLEGIEVLFDETQIRRELGARLRDARFRTGRTQAEAGEHVGLDSSAISRLETGKVEGPDLMVVLKLIEFYGGSSGRILDELGTKRVFSQGANPSLSLIEGDGRDRFRRAAGQTRLDMRST